MRGKKNLNLIPKKHAALINQEEERIIRASQKHEQLNFLQGDLPS